ncbi:hypothetical protein [Oerskovia jenensis]|uniref:hypothetical protein n=1 Tax=Oerskovia jenensis TaxID=162169 RepID=UPI0036DCE820
MPGLKSETFGAGDQSWLGSTHGIGNARSEKLDISTFTAGTHFPNGYIPSGLPVAKVGGVLVPYDPTEATVTNAGVLAGFVLADVRVNGGEDLNVALKDHGRVKSARLPIPFTPPVAAAKRAATTIVFI